MRKNISNSSKNGLTANQSNRLFLAGLIALAVSAFALPSCSWIEENPDSLITPAQLGDSEEACDQLVTGVYSKWI